MKADKQRVRRTLQAAVFVALGVLVYPETTVAAAVAQVFFVSGNVTARGADGSVRAVSKGTPINPGDLIDTGSGRAQLRFADGALVSLQSGSQFRVDQFRFEGTTDGSEKGFFSLLKGGLRTVTGLVGRFNRDAYQITTPTATIGIRGTEYLAKLGDSLVVSVGEGRVAVINSTGEFVVEAGQSVYVKDRDSKPEVTSTKPFLPPPGTQAGNTPPALPGYVAGDQYTPEGVPQWLGLTTTSEPPSMDAQIALSGANARTPDKALVPVLEAGFGKATCDDAGVCMKLEPGTKFIANSVSTFENGYDGVIGWGRWTGGRYNVTSSALGNTDLSDLQGLHYVYGAPTPALPTQGTATYVVLGATSPTSLDGSWAPGAFAGTLPGDGVLAVNFGKATMDVGFRASFANGPTYTVEGRQLKATPIFSLTNADLRTTGCGSAGCSVAVSGFFAGKDAERAGIAYQITDVSKSLSGAAALTRQ
ncbi:MAG: FecR family protein [Pseudomonadota bacterium]